MAFWALMGYFGGGTSLGVYDIKMHKTIRSTSMNFAIDLTLLYVLSVPLSWIQYREAARLAPTLPG